MSSREGNASIGTMPDRLVMTVRVQDENQCRIMANDAVKLAQHFAPKMSGNSARGFEPVWTETSFGVHWADAHVWFQEGGTRPFTMRSLANKTIPMWVADPTGEQRRKNPSIKTRTTADGRLQVLIFRKAAPIGSRKTVKRDGAMVDVPRSYPGAPGRINTREGPYPFTMPGKVGGRIARHNVGVRWRHPGLGRRSFIRQALIITAHSYDVEPGPVRDQFGRYQ